MADNCQSWVKIQRRVRRQHDTAVEDGFSSFDATLVRQQPETAGEGSDHLTGLNWNAPYSSPEYPLAFPEGPMQVWGRVDSNGARAPCPRVLRYLFKVHRLGQDLLDHMLASMPPKLLATTLSVCNSIDVLLAKLKSAGSFVQPPDDLPGWALKSQEWQESERIGRLVVRVDKHFSVMTGIDVNRVWAEKVAGLHREEFMSRGFAGEQRFATSELRTLVRILITLRAGLPRLLQAGLPHFLQTTKEGRAPPEPHPTTSTSFVRFSRNWGRSGANGPGVLVRMTSSEYVDESQPQWVYFQHTMVEVSAEEYEAVRAVNPDACEGELVPLVGSKSAGELLDPRLGEQESFVSLNASEEGRAVLDKLASKIREDFGFVLEALAASL